MMMSPSSMSSASWSTTWPVMPAGIITHATRGFSSLATKSFRSVVPMAPSCSNAATVSLLVSKATAVCPSRMMRRTMFAPIRPRPTIPSCMSVLLPSAAVPADQGVRRAVVLQVGFVVCFQFGSHLLRQHLAELDAPLVEGVHAPHRALYEHAVFVKGDQGAERVRREPLEQQGVRRAVALEDPVRHEPVVGALGLDLLCRLAESERLGLREDVRRQQVVMIAQRVERVREADEVTRNELGALVNQLVEAV